MPTPTPSDSRHHSDRAFLPIAGLLLLVAALWMGVANVRSEASSPLAPQAPACVVDQQGANDEPGQKDLTTMCESAGAFDTVQISWNWDDTAWTGTNTGDACSLFDTDGDGNANYSLCVTVAGVPATYQEHFALFVRR